MLTCCSKRALENPSELLRFNTVSISGTKCVADAVEGGFTTKILATTRSAGVTKRQATVVLHRSPCDDHSS